MSQASADVTHSVLRDRIAGSLYGLLVGDALGCPVEGWTAEQIWRLYGRVSEMEEPRGRWRPRGLHSDDGQQALALCDAILPAPEHPGPAFAGLLVELLRQGPRQAFGLHRGTGANFRTTVTALANGVAWDAAATHTAGNGAAMRIAPAGMYYRDDDATVAERVIEVSRVTHGDVRGIAAAGAVAWLVAHALAQSGPARELGGDALVAFVRAVEDRCGTALGTKEHLHSFSDALGRVVARLDGPWDALYGEIETLAWEGSARRSGATAGFVQGSVLTSIAMFLRSNDFERAVSDTVTLGGDADTTGAMVGAMCGARYGQGAIPRRWLDALVAYGALEDRVEALVARPASFTPGVSLVALERPWTALLLRGPGG